MVAKNNHCMFYCRHDNTFGNVFIKCSHKTSYIILLKPKQRLETATLEWEGKKKSPNKLSKNQNNVFHTKPRKTSQSDYSQDSTLALGTNGYVLFYHSAQHEVLFLKSLFSMKKIHRRNDPGCCSERLSA